MTIIETLLKEMEREAVTTRKMLSIIPDDKYNWKPHEKSMTVQSLATHIAELPAWVTMTLATTELDFAANQKATEEELLPLWTLRNGETVYSVEPKADVIRMAYCQIVHHRAQLGVYLRLLNIPIPGSYGPSADDMNF
ncbi:MAG: DinB family protein [Chitinophagaceae bacterium]|nr:DinB family protein [Chitinophagaceae bacterium]